MTTDIFGFRFDNSLQNKLPELCATASPSGASDPKLIIFNQPLSHDLNLDDDLLSQSAADILSGNQALKHSKPCALAYAGHQYGHFTMLGDGRAHLLGEHLTNHNKRYDIQLKGSGTTPFNKRGDGKASLGPMLREYLISEAMHALGIPTTRSLAVIATGEKVYRESTLPGAILSRVASSHLRVGTAELIATQQDPELLQRFIDYTLKRHYPQTNHPEHPGLSLLEAVITSQAKLSAQWQAAGFVHGVLNTDNISLAGETLDYGPCAFIDEYQVDKVFSSIDQHGRYAFNQQIPVMQWNLSCLANALLVFEKDPGVITHAQILVDQFTGQANSLWQDKMLLKIGFKQKSKETIKVLTQLLNIMQKENLDYHQTFYQLSYQPQDFIALGEEQKAWHTNWENLLDNNHQKIMQEHNPVVIPRNHQVEKALLEAVEQDNLEPFYQLLNAVQNPFSLSETQLQFNQSPKENEKVRQTFCGT